VRRRASGRRTGQQDGHAVDHRVVERAAFAPQHATAIGECRLAGREGEQIEERAHAGA
jgi:hypothetical protein